MKKGSYKPPKKGWEGDIASAGTRAALPRLRERHAYTYGLPVGLWGEGAVRPCSSRSVSGSRVDRLGDGSRVVL